MPAFDLVVIGLGAIGSATLLQSARRKPHVLGLDRWDPPHAWGSTHGDTRITRCAIGEGQAYVPLVLRSHEIWRELEAETGEQLLTQCGALILASASGAAVAHNKGDFVRRTIAAAEHFAIPHEVLTPDAIMARFPQFRLQGDEIGYFEPSGGYVRPERCVAAQLRLARQHGATIRTNTQVAAIARDGDGVCVTLADGERILAAEAVVAAGAWSPGLMAAEPELSSHMTVARQVLHWFTPDDPADFAPERFPVFIWLHGDRPEDSFYGFPIPPGSDGVKVATEQYAELTPDPDHLERVVSVAEQDAMMRDHLAGRLAGLRPGPVRSVACPYTNTPDGDFLIERAPGNPRVLLVSACSGHGFKHSAGLGDAVAALLDGDETSTALSMFRAERLASVAA